MANGTGVAILDFWTFPGSNEATVTVSDQDLILATGKADAFFMVEDSTSDHTANDHRYADLLIALACGTPTEGVGFTIYGTCAEKMQGTFSVRWCWIN